MTKDEINRVSLPGDDDYQAHESEVYCFSCESMLPQLENPRLYSGVCLSCVGAK